MREACDTLEDAAALVLGSPVYFGTVSAQLKALWDKTRAIRTRRSLVGKPAAAVSVGAARFGGQETTLKALHDMLLIQGMSIVGEGTDDADAGHQGVCAQKPAAEDSYALERARILGKAPGAGGEEGRFMNITRGDRELGRGMALPLRRAQPGQPGPGEGGGPRPAAHLFHARPRPHHPLQVLSPPQA